MKKTFNIIGAAVLGAAVLFGANSCAESQNNDSKQENNTTQADSTRTIIPAGSIVYIDMTRVNAEYQMVIDLGAEVEKKLQSMQKSLESKTKSIEGEIKRKQNNLTTKANDFQDKYSKGHLTETNANLKVQELQKLEEEYNNYVAQKEQELAQEQLKLQNTANEELFVMNNIVNDAINTFIKKYNAEKGYAMILISQGDAPNDGATILGNPVLTADPSLDITSEVIAGLNAEYKASK
jgi:outer membrane protein